MKTIIFPILFLFLIYSCQQNIATHTNEAIVNDSIESVPHTNTLMSSIISICNIVPLETSDSSLISDIEKVIKRNNCYYIKSRNSSLSVFDKNGRFMHRVGNIGISPHEYPLLSDFDVTDHDIYILSSNKILIFDLNGKWIKTIPIDLNASGIRLTTENILIFALGDSHVIHLLDKNGKLINKVLERNQTLRICRNISFIKYNNRYLFPMGRSNDILAYENCNKNTFIQMNYLSSEQLSNKEENHIIENSQDYHKEIENKGFFDGLLTNKTHAIIPFIKQGDVTLWIKNIKTNQNKAYQLSSLINDLTFSPTHSFFLDNMENEESFLTYIMPYRLKEYLKKSTIDKSNQHYKKLYKLIEKAKDDDNPIMIEYKIKDL